MDGGHIKMKLEIEFHSIELPVELMEICDVSAACVYAVLLAASENNACQMSRNEIAKKTGLKLTTIKVSFNKLEKLGIIERRYNKGYATTYYVKDILHPAERKEQPTEQKKEVKRVEQSEQPLPKVPVAPKYKFPYYVMLSNIGSSFANDFPLSESDVDALTDERETEECTIPAEWAFSDNQKMIEDALKFLSYYSSIKDGQVKDVKESTIIALSEAICTGKRGTVHGVDPNLIIDRLNSIIHSSEINLSQWLDDFARIFSEKFNSETQKIYNYHAYLKTAAINYLTEYKSQVYNGFYEDD